MQGRAGRKCSPSHSSHNVALGSKERSLVPHWIGLAGAESGQQRGNEHSMRIPGTPSQGAWSLQWLPLRGSGCGSQTTRTTRGRCHPREGQLECVQEQLGALQHLPVPPVPRRLGTAMRHSLALSQAIEMHGPHPRPTAQNPRPRISDWTEGKAR